MKDKKISKIYVGIVFIGLVAGGLQGCHVEINITSESEHKPTCDYNETFTCSCESEVSSLKSIQERKEEKEKWYPRGKYVDINNKEGFVIVFSDKQAFIEGAFLTEMGVEGAKTKKYTVNSSNKNEIEIWLYDLFSETALQINKLEEEVIELDQGDDDPRGLIKTYTNNESRTIRLIKQK